MAAAIQVDFRIGGLAEVDKAFRSVEQSVVRMESASARRTRTIAADANKLADAEIKATQRAEQTKAKETAAWSKQRDTIQTNAAKLAFKLADDEVKATRRAEEQKTREAERGAAQRESIDQQVARARQRAIDQGVRAVEKAAKDEQNARQRFGRGLGNSQSDKGTAAIMGLGATVMTLGGGFTVADAMQKQLSLEKQAALVSNASSRAFTTQQVISRAKGVGLLTNNDPAKIAESIKAYVDASGDTKGAMANAGLFGKIGTATGADLGQIGKTAGMLRAQNSKLSQPEMENMLLGIIGQGRLGAVDFAQLASVAPKVTATSAIYGGDQAMNQRKLLGLSQVAMRTAGSADESATVVTDLGQEALRNRKKLAAAGITVADKKGDLIDPATMIANIMKGAGGDLGKIADLGFGQRSIKMFQAEKDIFRTSGAEGVRADVSKYTDAGMSKADLDKDFANVMSTSAAKFEGATNRITMMVQEKLTPALQKFGDKLPEMMPAIILVIDGMGWLADVIIDLAKTASNVVDGLRQASTRVASMLALLGIGNGSKPVGPDGKPITLGGVPGTIVTHALNYLGGGSGKPPVTPEQIRTIIATPDGKAAPPGALPVAVPGKSPGAAAGAATAAAAGESGSADVVAAIRELGKKFDRNVGMINAPDSPNRKGPMSSPGRDGPP